jgi:small multidrug resistance pump
MAWFYLFLSITAEVIGTYYLKLSQGFSQFWETAFMILSYIMVVVFLGLSVKTLDVGLAYAIWAGITTVGIAAVGIVFFKEPIDVFRVTGIMLIIAGTLVLKLKDTTS